MTKFRGTGPTPLIVALALVAFTACGGADDPPQAPVVQAPKEKAPPAKAIVKVQDGLGGCDTCIPLPPPGHP